MNESLESSELQMGSAQKTHYPGAENTRQSEDHWCEPPLGFDLALSLYFLL